MDVGQVKFSIIADGLDDTLTKAGQLQGILNGMDGKTYRAGATKRANAETAYNRAVQRSLRNHKQLMNQTQKQADMYHKQSEKRIKDALKFSRINARNQAYAQKLEEQQYKQREKYQQKWETTLARQGARLQTLGATIQNITEPFANVYRGLAMGVGYKLLGTVQNSIEGAMSRFDTRNLYKKMMKEYSNANYSTAQSWNELDQSVIGLPTSVAEIAEMAQRYTLSLGNMERGTRLAIASNRAFLASMATDTQKYQGMLQLQDLMNGKELQPREWMSLGASMGKAINEIAKVMGAKTQEDIRKFRQELYAGKVNTEDFLDALEKVGNKGGKIYKMAEEYKDTIEALRKNVGNAFQRMGEHLLIALDDIFKSATGKGLVKNLLGITKAIDGISESAQEWIRANPTAIMDFFNDLKSINWQGMVSGFAQFGLTMGKIYTGLLKTFGGKGLIYAMLYGNLAGKGIQLAGGLEKGLAGRLSKIMTALKFGSSGKAIKGAKELAKNHGALIGATKTMGGMVLSWQDVASKAISVASIPAIAWSLHEIALAFQEFDKVDISWGSLANKILQAGAAVTAFGGLASAFGWLMTGATGTLLGKITLIGTASGLGAIAGISKVMKWVGEGLNAIAKAEIPSAGTIANVAESMAQIGTAFEKKNPFEAIGTILDAWSKGSEFKAIKNVTDAFKSMKELSKIKLSEDQLMKTKENFANLKIFMDDVESIFASSEATERAQSGATNGVNAYGNTNKYANYKVRMGAFADSIKAVADGLGNMQQLVTNANALQQMYTKISTHGRNEFDWGVLGRQMASIANGMYQLIDGGEESPMFKFKQLSNQSKGVNLDGALSTLKKIPKIVTQMQSIGKIDTASINTGNLDSLGDKINTFVTKISSAFSRAGSGFGGVSGMAMGAGALLAGVSAIKKAINKLNSIPMAKDMSGIVASVQTAVAQLNSIGTQIITANITIQGTVTDMVTPAITAAKDSIEKAMDSIKDQKKSVDVRINLGASTDNVTSYINRVASNIRAAINSIPSSVNKTVSVNVNLGKINRPNIGDLNDPLGVFSAHGGAIYRAGGGMTPRGTDIVPAMLTPGEFVLKQRAASMLGHTLLNRLNHLDIRGALSELSARASQRSSMVSTVNNTKNISLTMNNNNSPGIGLSKTSGWLNRL